MLTPGPQVVNGPSHQSLAGPWFAHNEHGRGVGSRQANLFEEPSMRRACADQGIASERLMEPLSQLHEPDAKPVSLRIRHAGRRECLAHLAENSDQRAALVATRPELDPAPEPLATGVEDDGQASGRLAGDRLRWWNEAGSHVGRLAGLGRTIRGTGLAKERVGRMPGQSFPGSIDPGHAERLIEPEHRLARLLPELVRLERRNAWRRHEKWSNLGYKENEDSDQPLDRSRPGSRCRPS